MPRLSRAFVHAALLWLVLALGTRLADALVDSPSVSSAVWLGPTSLHLLVVGWLTPLIFGVAWWMFPRLPKSCRPDPAWLGWSVLVALNLGLLLRCLGEPAGVSGVLLVSALLQLLAALGFAASAWRRVAPR